MCARQTDTQTDRKTDRQTGFGYKGGSGEEYKLDAVCCIFWQLKMHVLVHVRVVETRQGKGGHIYTSGKSGIKNAFQ